MNETEVPDLPPELLDLRDRYGAESSLVHLDPDEPLEALVHAGLRADPAYAGRLSDAWSALLAAVGDDEEEFLERFLPLAPLPAGRSWLAWARYVERLIPRIVAGGEPFPVHTGQPWGQPLAFAPSTFPDTQTANWSATEVVRRHEHLFRRWGVDAAGLPRLRLYADLGREVGSRPVLTGTRIGLEVMTAAVVLMRRDSRGRPYVATAHPESSVRDRSVRRGHELGSFLGGYFGQDLHAFDRTAWDAEAHFAREASPAVRGRVVEQLVDLVREGRDGGDAVLRARLADLGVYLALAEPRRWLLGLHRRLSELA